MLEPISYNPETFAAFLDDLNRRGRADRPMLLDVRPRPAVDSLTLPRYRDLDAPTADDLAREANDY